MISKARVYTLYAETPDGPLLLAQIEIECPVCGDLRFVIPGHHLRTVRDCLIDVIDQYPNDAGPEAGPKLQSAQRSTITVDGAKKPEWN